MRRTRISGGPLRLPTTLLAAAFLATALHATQPSRAPEEATPLPAGPLVFGAFQATFSPDGTFAVRSDAGWPPLAGHWRIEGDQIELSMPGAPSGCYGPGRYSFAVQGKHLLLRLIEDGCGFRSMILGASDWRPADVAEEIPERRIVRTTLDAPDELPEPAGPEGSWSSFRGSQAAGIADGMMLPDRWSGESGENVLWRSSIPGLAHSSPIVWGDRVFVTSAVSSRSGASFRPGLYGDGDASQDRSLHRFEVTALDKNSGEIRWRRVVDEAVPIDKRHIKSTYANATPTTDGGW